MKVFVSDYDGTFFLNEKDLGKNLEMVKKWREKGNLFIFATGRNDKDFYKVKDQYHLSYDYVILNHGTTIYDEKGNLLYSVTIPSKLVNSVITKLGNDPYELYKTNGEVSKISILYKNQKEASKRDEELRDLYYEFLHVYLVSPYRVEMIPRDVNKRTGIDFLVQHLHLKEDDVYVIGDGHSDVPMVRRYHGGAIQSGIPSLSDYAENTYPNVSAFLKEILDK